MLRKEVYENLQEIIRDVFDDEEIIISENTVADDINGWDSFMHITLMGTIEDEFNVRFPMEKLARIKNVGDIIDLVLEQKGEEI